MLVVSFVGPPPRLDGWCELVTYSGAFFLFVFFFFFFFFKDDCLLIKTKCDIEDLFCNRFCRAFLSIFNTKAYKHALFFKVMGHFLSWCKYTPFPCSLTSMPFGSKQFLFLGNLQTSFLVVICGVTVACFSAPFSVLTGILFFFK